MGAAKLSHCAEQVRRTDHDRYLTALFVPARAREALFALYAFNVELARTREVVTDEPMVGHIRLKWWREAVDAAFAGRPRATPVAEALAAAIAEHGLERAAFDTMLDARERDLDDTPPANCAELENYAADTAGMLATLAMAVLGYRDGAPRAAARQVGTAWALTGLVRAVAFHAKAGRSYLPADRVDALGIDRTDLQANANLKKLIEEICSIALKNLDNAREHRREIPRPARAGLLLAPLGDGYLRAIARAGHDVLALPPAPPARPLRLWWAARRGAY